MSADCAIRRGMPDDFLGIVRLFDAALLETDGDRLRTFLSETTHDGFVLLATISNRPVGAIAVRTAATPGRDVAVDHNLAVVDADRDSAVVDADSEPVAHITALAVRPTRRDQGIGRALVSAAADRVAPRPLSATFDERIRPFYAACGFETESRDGRLWGIHRVDNEESGRSRQR